MTDYLYDTALNERLTYARQAQSAWLWTDDSERRHILLKTLDALLPFCSSLACSCAEETRCGIFEDKMLLLNRLIQDIRIHCLNSTVINQMRLSCTDTYTEYQSSGTLTAVISTLHPVSEILFASAISIRNGSPLILSFHPDAFQVSVQTASLVRDAAVMAGAPDNCIQWLENSEDNFIQKINDCPDISGLILSGLSSDIQKYFSAFSKACILAFPQSVFCYVHHSAFPKRTAEQIVLSRTFDNGLNDVSEQIIFADRDILVPLKKALNQEDCYFASQEEITRLTAVLADLSSGHVNSAVIGQSPQTLAALADITIPDTTRLIVLEIEPDTASHPLLLPLLCPILILMAVDDYEQAAEKIRFLSTKTDSFSTESLFPEARKLPAPHSLVIHTASPEPLTVFSHALQNFTIIENAPAASHSITFHYMDAFGNMMTPTAIEHLFSARCAHSSINETARNFYFPAKIFYEKNALDQLILHENETHILFLQNNTFSDTEVQAVIQKIQQKYPFIHYERQHLTDTHTEMTDFQCQLSLFPELPAPVPDCLIVIGDETAVNIAKMLVERYQHQNRNTIPRLIIITANAGCHTALLPFYSYYDSRTNQLTDTACFLPPFTLIANASFTFSRSLKTCINACLAAMSDAFDALFSGKSDDLSDAMALRAVQLFLTWLPELLSEKLEKKHQKNRPDACLEHLQNACILSGLACSHTGPGLSRVLSRQLCCEFRISMNTLQAILLPHLLLYYADPHPSRKTWTFSDTSYSAINQLKMLIPADQAIDNACNDDGDTAAILARKLDTILDDAHLPANIKNCNIREKDYLQRIDDLALHSFEQLSTNCIDVGPRYPLVKELVQILQDIY